MAASLALTPSGRLDLLDSPPDDPLAVAFADSSAAGLLALVRDDTNLPGEFVFWRSFARDLFERIAHLGESTVEQWAELPPPREDELAHLAADAPLIA